MSHDIFDVISLGGVVRDIIFYSNQGKTIATPENLTAQRLLAFEYGAKIDIKDVFLNFGGGAANSSVTFSKLGLKVAALARVGQDEAGQELIKQLKKEGVYTNFIQHDSKAKTGFSFILATEKEREHIAFLYRGANKKLTFSLLHQLKVKAGWFYLTSLSGKNWPGELKRIFDFAKKQNINIAWNPGNLQLAAGQRALAGFLKQTSLLILNKDEAIELVLSGIKLGRKNPNCLNQPVYLSNILQEWGPKMVLITSGKKGACLYDGKKIYQQKAIKSKVADTTGVGDAFGSTFLAGYIKTKSNINQSLKWAALNSSSVVTETGAQNGLLTLKELKSKL
jgi:sugar/nucleoside kinase (ribokinase family)